MHAKTLTPIGSRQLDLEQKRSDAATHSSLDAPEGSQLRGALECTRLMPVQSVELRNDAREDSSAEQCFDDVIETLGNAKLYEVIRGKPAHKNHARRLEVAVAIHTCEFQQMVLDLAVIFTGILQRSSQFCRSVRMDTGGLHWAQRASDDLEHGTYNVSIPIQGQRRSFQNTRR
jgi:hypothetical protein